MGNTLEAIAREKAGIIKEGMPVVVGETTEETLPYSVTLPNKNTAKYTSLKRTKKLSVLKHWQTEDIEYETISWAI